MQLRAKLAAIGTVAGIGAIIGFKTALPGVAPADALPASPISLPDGAATTSSAPATPGGSEAHGSATAMPEDGASAGAAGGGDGNTNGAGGAQDPAAQAPETPGDGGATTDPQPGAASSDTIVGDAAPTRYGDVQVQITVSGDTITDIVAVRYPNSDRRDQMINQYAIPQLISEALAAQSAQIDSVSGATFTSDGFVTSLQSAITKAGL